jgi:hypothetical protein
MPGHVTEPFFKAARLYRTAAGNNYLEAHRLAEAILRLDGLTGAEIEAAESVLSDEPADIQRLRQIAANHSILILNFL